MDDETLVFSGGEIKSLGLSDDGRYSRIGGYLVHFGTPDLANDVFDSDTDFGPALGNGAPALIHHGLPLKRNAPELDWTRSKKLAPLTVTKDEIGLFAETVCDLHDAHEAKVDDLVKRGKLKWSSGADPKGVKRVPGADPGTKKLVSWPIIEGSLTPTPCQHGGYTAVSSLKSFVEEEGELDAEVEEELKYSHTQPRDDDGKWTIIAGSAHRIEGRSVSREEVTAAAQKHGVSEKGVELLQKAHDEGKVTTDDHLLRSIAHGIHHADGDKNNAAEIANGIKKHGVGGTHEGKFGGWEGHHPLMRETLSKPTARSQDAPADANEGTRGGETFSVSDARYAKGKKVLRIQSQGTFKGTGERLAESLGGNYTGRDRGYQLSPNRAEAWKKLHATGWDAGPLVYKEQEPKFYHDKHAPGGVSLKEALVHVNGAKKSLDFDFEEWENDIELKYSASQPRAKNGEWTGGGTGPGSAYHAGTTYDGPATDKRVNRILEIHGLGADHPVAVAVREAAHLGHIKTERQLENVLTESALRGHTAEGAKTAIQRHGAEHDADRDLRHGVVYGQRHRYSEARKALDEAGFTDIELAPEEAMASGAQGDTEAEGYDADLWAAQLQNEMLGFDLDLGLHGLSAFTTA